MSRFFAFFFIFLAIALLSFCWYLSHVVVVGPYMDEIFHIPQAIAYTKGQWSHWDGKITTPPALYLFSLPLYWSFSSIVPSSVFILRSVNVLFSLGILLVTRSIISLGNNNGSTSITWSAFNVFLFPVSFFFYFFYYTDTGSTFFVLLCYRASMSRNYWLSGIFALAAIAFRQTNLVWALFVAGCSILRELEFNMSREEWARKIGLAECFLPLHEINDGIDGLRILVKFAIYSVYHWGQTVRAVFPFASIGLACFYFVHAYNGGTIVFGDKENHKASFHPPQILYFCAFTAFFLVPLLLPSVSRKIFVRSATSLSSWMLLAACIVSVRYFTVEHPFLLADNRHFTFYIWRWFFRRHWIIRYLLCPVYVVCWRLVSDAMVASACPLPFIQIFGLFVATILALVPSPLLEFRYFIVPFVLIRISISMGKRTLPIATLLLETLMYLAINCAVFYIFICRPFVWPSEPGSIQRFMW